MNVVYINTHDTGKMISPYGHSVPTDGLMEFAKDATTFTQCFCCGPTCSPSRASLLTGTYPHQNGMLGLAQRGFSLNDPNRHLANILKSKGYNTCIAGIQHEYGWYLDKDDEGLHNLGYKEILTEDSKKYKKEELHLWDKANANKVVKWLSEYQSSEPFLLSYGLHCTHRPYPIEVIDEIDENYVIPVDGYNNASNRHDHAQFLTSAYYADECIKMVIDELKHKGLYDNTLIIYTTDHGLALPFHKCNLQDAGIGVSLIMRNPLAKKHNMVVDSLVSHIDVLPTILEILNIDQPTYLEGKSFNRLFSDNSLEINEEVYAEVNFHTSYEPIRAIRTKRYKYIRYYDDYKGINCSNMDESKPKDFLLENGLRDKIKYTECLYDLYYDTSEKDNLTENKNYSSIKDELSAKLDVHLVRTNDPILKGELEIKKHYKVNKKECIMASSKDPNDYVSLG